MSKATVYAVISRYNRPGVETIVTPGRGGRRRQYLTLEEERKFLAPFFAQAERGEIATVEEIWRAFEQHVGHPIDDSTIYRLLHRHEWRKLMPRPKHPKSDLETQEQFKKLSCTGGRGMMNHFLFLVVDIQEKTLNRQTSLLKPFLLILSGENGKAKRFVLCWLVQEKSSLKSEKRRVSHWIKRLMECVWRSSSCPRRSAALSCCLVAGSLSAVSPG